MKRNSATGIALFTLYWLRWGLLKIKLPCFQVLLYLRVRPIFVPPGKENSDGQGETNLKDTFNQCALRSCTSPKSFVVIQKLRIFWLCLKIRMYRYNLRPAGCNALLKRIIDTILLPNTWFLCYGKWFRWKARPKCIVVEGAPLTRPRKREWSMEAAEQLA